MRRAIDYVGAGFATEVVHTNLLVPKEYSTYKPETVAKKLEEREANLKKSCLVTPLIAELREIAILDGEESSVLRSDSFSNAWQFATWLAANEKELVAGTLKVACIHARRLVKLVATEIVRREKALPLPFDMDWFVDPYCELVSEHRQQELKPDAFARHFNIAGAYSNYTAEVAAQTALAVASSMQLPFKA